MKTTMDFRGIYFLLRDYQFFMDSVPRNLVLLSTKASPGNAPVAFQYNEYQACGPIDKAQDLCWGCRRTQFSIFAVVILRFLRFLSSHANDWIAPYFKYASKTSFPVHFESSYIIVLSSHLTNLTSKYHRMPQLCGCPFCSVQAMSHAEVPVWRRAGSATTQFKKLV
jgi:hypothetical protein